MKKNISNFGYLVIYLYEQGKRDSFMSNQEFFTFREYMRKDGETLSASAEDYLEMIYRLSKEHGFTRVNDLAGALNVQPPSVTKMIRKLSELEYLKYEKYGVIMLEPKGFELGATLLDRHNLVESFLKILNIKEGLLEDTEKIEHTMNAEVLYGIKNLLEFFKDYPELLIQFNEYQHGRRKRK